MEHVNMCIYIYKCILVEPVGVPAKSSQLLLLFVGEVIVLSSLE